MLTKFRRSANSIVVRVLLGVIALSFIGFGASSFLGGNEKGDIVVFSKTKSIPVETFLAVKAQQLEQIQRKKNINLTDEQIKNLNIDQEILQKLVHESMITYLGEIYDFDISEEMVISYLKKIPYFRDEKGNFDLNLFKSTFHHSQSQEDEYLKSLKTNLIKSSLLEIFIHPFNPSKIMLNIVADYMTKTKYYNLVSIDLNYNKNDFINNQIAIKELEDFYNKNESSFFLPETRSFDYILIDKDFFSKKINISKAEMKAYYEENQREFNGKAFSKSLKIIHNMLYELKLQESLTKFSKTLEEDVASGINLKDIANKYSLKISSVINVDKANLINGNKSNLSSIADPVFEMFDHEVSYPIELLDQNKIIIIELTNIKPSRKQEFNEARDQVYSVLQEQYIVSKNLKILEDIKNHYDPEKNSTNYFSNQQVSLDLDKSLSRSDLQSVNKMNPELVYLILNTDVNHSTNIVRDKNKAYFAYIKGEKINRDKSKKFIDTSSEQIANAIKEGLMEELIGYLSEQNQMKVKL